MHLKKHYYYEIWEIGTRTNEVLPLTEENDVYVLSIRLYIIRSGCKNVSERNKFCFVKIGTRLEQTSYQRQDKIRIFTKDSFQRQDKIQIHRQEIIQHYKNTHNTSTLALHCSGDSQFIYALAVPANFVLHKNVSLVNDYTMLQKV